MLSIVYDEREVIIIREGQITFFLQLESLVWVPIYCRQRNVKRQRGMTEERSPFQRG